MLVVINKDLLLRGGLCGKLHGGRSQLSFALDQSFIRLPDIRRELIFAYPSGGSSHNTLGSRAPRCRVRGQ